MEASTTDSSCNKAQSTVNVRMLDGDNFETHWGVLVPPLPGPPDHELRSPFIAAELQPWTNDSVLHQSLVAWMESIMEVNDPESIPPLTLNGLDQLCACGGPTFV